MTKTKSDCEYDWCPDESRGLPCRGPCAEPRVKPKSDFKELLKEAEVLDLVWMNKQINKEIVRRLQETEDR